MKKQIQLGNKDFILDSDTQTMWDIQDKRFQSQKLRSGYQAVRTQGKNYYLHRLMAQAFIPNPDNLPQVNHKDSNKLNNNLNNLEWISHANNIKHGFATGDYKKTKAPKFTHAEIYLIRWHLAAGASQYKTAARFGVPRETIQKIASGTNYGALV